MNVAVVVLAAVTAGHDLVRVGRLASLPSVMPVRRSWTGSKAAVVGHADAGEPSSLTPRRITEYSCPWLNRHGGHCLCSRRTGAHRAPDLPCALIAVRAGAQGAGCAGCAANQGPRTA